MKLLPHQIEDAAKIAGGDDLPNFSEAGTGKTLTTLEAVKLAKLGGGLVLAPSIALPMWKEEIEKYLGASATILKTGKSPLKGTDFHITSYGLAANLGLRERLMERGGGVLILDEGHYLKNHNSKRTQAVFGRSTNGRGGLFEAYSQCWNLTGTPIMRHANDIWAQLRATQPNALRDYGVLNYDDFVRRFCIVQVKRYHPRMPMQRVVVASQQPMLLQEMLYQNIGAVRRSMNEVSSTMPPLTYRDLHAPLPKSAELNELLGGASVEDLMKMMEADDKIMAKAMRILGSLKADSCIEYLLEQDHPVLCGYWHTDIGDYMVEKLREEGRTVARVMGGMSSQDKEDVRGSFNRGNIDVLVGQISAMNVSWNLQKCGNHVVILEDQFSPGLIEQFVKRVWRFGQEQHVQVDFIKSGHPLDEAITRVRTEKEKTSRVILG